MSVTTSNSGVGFTAKVQPHGYGYVGRLSGRSAKRLKSELRADDWRRISRKMEEGMIGDVLEDIRLSEQTAHFNLDRRSKFDRTPRQRTGIRGMSNSARHRVRANISALCSVAPEGTLAMFTATCPEISYQEDEIVASSWSRVVHNFIKRLRRLVEAKGGLLNYAHVTEIQESRWVKTGKPYLHLHLVFQGKRTAREQWYVTPTELRQAWIGALNSVLVGDPVYLAITDVRPCDKGVGRYLSKYLSKGASITAQVRQVGLQNWFPKQWYGASHRVTQEREALTYKERGRDAELLLAAVEDGSCGAFKWRHEVVFEGQEGTKYRLGWVFVLEPWAYVELMVRGVGAMISMALDKSESVC